MEYINIKNAYEHNLKHLNLQIPLDSFTCVTGCSGCGKSSLVFDTIYAESQRALLEGITGNIQGQKLMNKPKVGAVENLRPALNISQNYYNVNPRSSVGTVTEISYYLRALFSLVNSRNGESVPENVFSSNNPQTFCPNCHGLGVETVVSMNLLIPDPEKTLRDGGILLFKGATESKEQKYLEALCDQYGIDIDKKVSELNRDELHKLLYADEHIRYKLAYKEGKRRKQHFVSLDGAVTIINDKLSHVDSSVAGTPYFQYLEDVPCHVCGGSKFKNDILRYTVDDYSYPQVENMELTSLSLWLNKLLKEDNVVSGNESIADIIQSMLRKIDALLELNVGYLTLNRSIPSLSGGERQRVRIANQLTCSLRGLLYILDEPCKGLHYRDITRIIDATKNMIERGNTVIAIEHNKQYIAAADSLVELGPEGGPRGGYLLKIGSNDFKGQYQLNFKSHKKFSKYIEIEGIHFHNIDDQKVKFPVGGITSVTGVSGSGKSSLMEIIAECYGHHSSKYCREAYGSEQIRRVVRVNQAPIGKTPRSTVVSYLGIFDEIRTLFVETDSAKKNKLSKSMFSMNTKGGRCECCQGTGLQKIELNYLPSSFITCPECGGKRFTEKVLSVKYCGQNISDILDNPISDIIELFKDSKKIYSVLNSMVQLGLGYLKLGQMSMNLSGGEAQRIKLAKALGTASTGKNLYLLDEPTSGLNDVDIERFAKVLLSLQDRKETIVLIEHNIEFIASISDYIIDFGIFGGTEGGKVMAQGTSQEVFENSKSSLYGLDGI